MVKVSVVIVNWNTGDFLIKCLSSIKKNTDLASCQVFVIDNASSDNSVEIVRKRFPWVKVIANDENLGFAKANNQILRKIKSEYVFILNPDTVLKSNTLGLLLNFMDENQDIAACGPLLLNQDNTIQKKGYYHRSPSLIQAILFYTKLYYKSIKNKYLMKNFWEDEFDIENPKEVEQIPGACLFARTSILKKVNFFDEEYYLWFEDVDLCYRLKKAGYKLMIIPKSRIIHKGGGAFDRWRDDVSRETQFFRSLFLFFKKNSHTLKFILVKLIIILNYLYLIFTRSIKQILTPTNDRKIFIYTKLKILWKLL